MLQTVILCGGLATRLYPTTKTIPKSLMMIEDTPFISYQLDLLHKKGITDVILCVGKFEDMIEDYVGDGSFWGLNVKYSYEDENNLLGTGGAIKNTYSLLEDEFMIMYGDSYLDIDFEPIIDKFHTENKHMLMTIFHNKNNFDESNILFKDRIIKYDKNNPTPDMEHIEYGLTIVKKSVFSSYKEDKFDLSLLMQDLILKDLVSVYEVKNRFYEVGSFRGVKEFKKYLANI